MKEKIAAVLEIIGEAEAFRPVVGQAVESIKKYGPEVNDLFTVIALGSADIRIKVVKKFEDAGFTREEAIYMTMDEWWGFSRRLNSNNKKK